MSTDMVGLRNNINGREILLLVEPTGAFWGLQHPQTPARVPFQLLGLHELDP